MAMRAFAWRPTVLMSLTVVGATMPSLAPLEALYPASSYGARRIQARDAALAEQPPEHRAASRRLPRRSHARGEICDAARHRRLRTPPARAEAVRALRGCVAPPSPLSVARRRALLLLRTCAAQAARFLARQPSIDEAALSAIVRKMLGAIHHCHEQHFFVRLHLWCGILDGVFGVLVHNLGEGLLFRAHSSLTSSLHVVLSLHAPMSDMTIRLLKVDRI